MTRRSAIVLSGVGLAAALALWFGPSTDDAGSGEANTQARLASTGPPPHPTPSAPATAPATPTAPSLPPSSASSVPPSTPPFAATGLAVPIAVTAPQKVLVGEVNELAVHVGVNAGFSEIGFTVRVDPNVLQVRSGTQGSWAVAVGVNPRFAAEISDTEDRVQVRSALSGQRAGLAGGSVATVQFQAITTGTTSVLISDVVVKDSSGRSMLPALSASNLQVTVESVPARPPVTGG